MNFIPACLIGPVYEYNDYADYLNRRGDYSVIPNNLKAMGKEALTFIVALVIYVATMRFNI